VQLVQAQIPKAQKDSQGTNFFAILDCADEKAAHKT